MLTPNERHFVEFWRTKILPTIHSVNTGLLQQAYKVLHGHDYEGACNGCQNQLATSLVRMYKRLAPHYTETCAGCDNPECACVKVMAAVAPKTEVEVSAEIEALTTMATKPLSSQSQEPDKEPDRSSVLDRLSGIKNRSSKKKK